MSLVPINRHDDIRGALSVINDVDCCRAFWMRCNSRRGGHAHRACTQTIVCMRGSALIALWDGVSARVEIIKEDSPALRIPPMIWVDIDPSQEQPMLLVFADKPYDEAEYIRDRSVYTAEQMGAS